MQSDDQNDDHGDPLTPEAAAESEPAWQAYLRGEDMGSHWTGFARLCCQTIYQSGSHRREEMTG